MRGASSRPAGPMKSMKIISFATDDYARRDWITRAVDDLGLVGLTESSCMAVPPTRAASLLALGGAAASEVSKQFGIWA